ncbi:sulfatase family protein [Anatilimnocola aggregata]|nr:sulfatase-like hydrolase/transferase [Anatilimnocola aggregata]
MGSKYKLTILIIAAAILAAALRPATADETTVSGRAPNVLLIITDDHGYGDVSTYHESDVQTPNIDRLAAGGMLFTGMRANCTVCSPSRAALLTGRYADRVGVPGVIRTQPENSWGYFDPRVPTLANELKAAGYHTGIVGKWHLGLESPNTPNERGFDTFRGFLGDMMDSYATHARHGNNYLRHNSEVITAKGHATDLFTDWAIDHLRERAKQPAQPFFLYLAYNAPHFPIEPPAEWLAKVKQRAPQLSDKRASNVAFVEHLDDRIGRVLTALKEAGLEGNTVVVFTADNGGSLPHGQNNAPWRDGKQSHYDGGLRVPFMVRWPGRIQAGSRSNYAGLNFDLFPTFLELAGRQPAADLDAVSLVSVLRGETINAPRDLYFVRREGGAAYGGKSYEALIRGEWKLLQNDPFSPLELYNLKADPQETNNLAKVNIKMVQELSAALRKHIQRGGSTPWQAPVIAPQSAQDSTK